jgi:hypothetical protein
MGVFKEAMYFTAEIVKQQKQIYNDACDYGVPIKSLSDPAIKMSQQLIEMYGEKTDYRNVDKYLTGKTVTRELTMIDEYGDGSEFKMRIVYTTVTNNKNTHPSSLVGKIIGILTIESPKWTDRSDNKYI